MLIKKAITWNIFYQKFNEPMISHWVIVSTHFDLSIDQNNHEYDICHDQAALLSTI